MTQYRKHYRQLAGGPDLGCLPHDREPEEDAGDLAETEAEPAEEVARKGCTVGTGNYLVRQGECMASIANERGFFWKTLWQLPENAELASVRKDPNVLLPGDRVFVPPLRHKDVEAQTDKKHRFVRKGEPSIFRVTIIGYDGPRAGEPYRLHIDGNMHSGNLDDDGTLEVRIPGNAHQGVLWVGWPPYEDRYDIQLGALDPAGEATGIRVRLENLGFDCGSEMELTSPITRAALASFQEQHGLAATGDLDANTRQRLESEHASNG